MKEAFRGIFAYKQRPCSTSILLKLYEPITVPDSYVMELSLGVCNEILKIKNEFLFDFYFVQKR